MAAAEIRSANDQKKLFLAIGLGIVAIIALWWVFIGFGSSQSPPVRTAGAPSASTPSPRNAPPSQRAQPEFNPFDVTPVEVGISRPVVPEPGRNIFAFYVPPPVPSPKPPTPTPPKPPDILVTATSPSSVVAQTEEFSLEVRGDRFTPTVSIMIEGRPFPTRYISPQQLSTTVPASMIANAGSRRIEVKSADGLLFSNQLQLSVTAPPVPNYNFVGIIMKKSNIGDTALLQEKSTKEIISAQRGDVIGGRFRVTSISNRELLVVDTSLKIKQKLTFTNEGDKGSGYPLGRPTPKVQSEDDEP
jgi:hypothetical protein